MASNRDPDYGAVLAEREIQVLKGMALGKGNLAIGRELFISEDTVKTHARRLFRKLGARDRANAVWLAVKAGILTIPSPDPAPEPKLEFPLPQVEWLRKPEGTHPVRCFTQFGCRCAGQVVAS